MKTKLKQFIIVSKDSKWIMNHNKILFENIETVTKFDFLWHFRSYIYESKERCKKTMSWVDHYKDDYSINPYNKKKCLEILEKGMVIKEVDIVLDFNIKEE